VAPTQLGPIDRASPYLPLWVLRKNKTMDNVQLQKSFLAKHRH
jgi:hypothetical protein